MNRSRGRGNYNNNGRKPQQQHQRPPASKVQIPRIEVPRDPTDANYTVSFTVNQPQELVQFFNEYGFVVVRDVLTPQECTATMSEVFDILEFYEPQNCRWDRNDTRTWDQWPTNAMERFGSPSRPPIFTRQFMLNRVNPNMHKVFSILLKEDDLIVNHDRCCLYRPTKNVTTSIGKRNMEQWATAPNLHLDMSPWCYLSPDGHVITERELKKQRYENTGSFIFENNQISGDDGLQLQGVINLVDNWENDGGFQCVPGFHKIFDDYFNSIAEQSSPNPLRSILEPDFDKNLTGGYSFHKNDIINRFGVRVPLRAGSVVVWDQKLPHGSDRNNSERLRSAQFIKMYPAKSLRGHKQRADARRRSVRQQLELIQPPLQLDQRSLGLLDLN